MKKDTKTICLYGVAVVLLLVGLFIPHFFGGRFTKYPVELPPTYFYYLKYALECSFLFTDLVIFAIIIIKAINKK